MPGTMSPKNDISSRQDIEIFIRAFYDKVIKDPTIGIIFTELVHINWDHHISLINDFWETILLDNPVYKNNAMDVHYKLHAMYPLGKHHFDAWLNLFNQTLDEMYVGPITSLAKKRALSIARLMEFKMNDK